MSNPEDYVLFDKESTDNWTKFIDKDLLFSACKPPIKNKGSPGYSLYLRYPDVLDNNRPKKIYVHNPFHLCPWGISKPPASEGVEKEPKYGLVAQLERQVEEQKQHEIWIQNFDDAICWLVQAHAEKFGILPIKMGAEVSFDLVASKYYPTIRPFRSDPKGEVYFRHYLNYKTDPQLDFDVRLFEEVDEESVKELNCMDPVFETSCYISVVDAVEKIWATPSGLGVRWKALQIFVKPSPKGQATVLARGKRLREDEDSV